MPDLPKTRAELARLIDHTLLKPEATQEQIERLCEECLQCRFAAACVNPYWVRLCASRLADSPTVVASVVGFPLGASSSDAKAYEATGAIEDGAREIDMVVNLGALIGGQTDAVVRDIETVVESARRVDPDAVIKVILETRALTEQQIILGCQSAARAGADFVKTSTGFHPAGGATVAHVALLRRHARGLKIKAAGGIRDLPTALAMLEAGADRLGLSASIHVILGLPA